MIEFLGSFLDSFPVKKLIHSFSDMHDSFRSINYLWSGSLLALFMFFYKESEQTTTITKSQSR